MNYVQTETPPETQAAQGAGLGLAWIGVGFVAFGALAIAIAAMFFPNRGSGTGPRVGSSVRSGPQRIQIAMTEFALSPKKIEVAPGTDLTLVLRNRGSQLHDLKLSNGVTSKMLKPGEVQVLKVGIVSESLAGICSVAGHKEAGMTFAVQVIGDEAPAADLAAVDDAFGSDAAAVIDPAAKPAAGWKPFDPALKPAAGATEHKLTFRATEKVIEVAPGVMQEMWTFNDQVPGPTLRGKVGDVFTVTLVNDGKLGHSVDFHASRVAWNDEMRTINPGESLVYQYKAEYAGVFMYHCGTAPALHHIGNGMFGAVVIDPPGLAPVAHELVLVQSELYLGPQHKPGDLTKMQNEAWDAVVFNSYVNQYRDSPIRVEPGERVRVFVLDAGPSENSAFHIVGTVFDTVFKEGSYLLRPDGSTGGSQALDLQPSQGGFVEFSFAEPGLYPIVTHKFANVGKGALGLFQAGELAPAGAGTGSGSASH